MACKPGSVHAADLRRNMGRPFLWDAPRGTPHATNPGGGTGMSPRSPVTARAAAPIRSCSRWGLPCRTRCLMRGALLPHRFALARGTPCGSCAGGLFSVALSLRSPPPAVGRHRIPVEPGLSSDASRPQRPSGRLAEERWDPRWSGVKQFVPAPSSGTVPPGKRRTRYWPATSCHPPR